MRFNQLMRGFTLLELLVVVGVIGVLIALLLPSLKAARESARSSACLANQHNIGHALTIYHNSNRDWFPLSSHTTGSLVSSAGWLQTLVPCGVLPASRKCPADEFRDKRLTSYCPNDHLEPLVAGIDFDPFSGKTLPGGREKAYTRVSELPRPAATVYAVEPLGEGTVDHLHSVGWTTPQQVAASIAVDRHRGSANYLFCDGHAESIAWTIVEANFSAERNFLNPVTAW